MYSNPSRDVHRRCGRLLLAATAGLLTLVAAHPASGDDLPTETFGNAKLTANITPVDDVDEFSVDLLLSDRIIVKVKEAGPARGISPNIGLYDPSGADTGVNVSGQGGFRPSFQYTALDSGTHVVRVEGASGGLAGSTGNYSITVKVKRFKAPKTVFNEAAGGAISYTFSAVADSLVTLTAGTRKGGLELTDLKRPDGRSEPGFADALNASSNGRKAKLKKFPLTGGTGFYEAVGTYEAGSKVSVKVKVKFPKGKARGRMTDLEPQFDRFLPPFPAEGIAGTEMTVVGQNLLFEETKKGLVPPSFWVGDAQVDPAEIEQPGNLGGVFVFPVPDGLAPGLTYDVIVRNADGQGSVAPGAFFYVPPPSATGMTNTVGGPAGGRTVTIDGAELRGGTVAIFDTAVSQPNVIEPDRLVVRSPPHAPGDVTVTLRDSYGQTAVVPGTFTYLDVPSNRIDSITPATVQGFGGETVTIDGSDFGNDSVFTFGGEVVAAVGGLTQRTFVADPRAVGVVTLLVEDQYEQPSSLNVQVTGLTDATTLVIPPPHPVANQADGWRATCILSGDVDGKDGPDLVLFRPAKAFGGDINRSRARLLLNNGVGAFSDATDANMPKNTVFDDYRALDATFVDLHGDGDLDIALIVTDQLDDGDRSSLRILENDGSGVFTDVTDDSAPANRLSMEAGVLLDHNQGVAVVAADVDGVNGDDLLILHTDFFMETIVIDPGDPTQDPPIPETTQDLYYPGLRVLLNDGDGVFTRDDDALPDVDPDAVTQYQGTALAAGNVDTDGDIDVVITRASPVEFPRDSGLYEGAATLLENTGGGTFVDSTSSLPDPTDPDYLHGDRAFLVNVDSDSDLDLLVLSDTRLVSPLTGSVSSDPATRIYLNNGSGVFTVPSAGTLPGAAGLDSLQAADAAVGDLNGDGRRDVVLISTAPPNSDERALRVLLGSATGFVRRLEPLPDPLTADDGNGATVTLVDVDGDGDLDVVFGRDKTDETSRNTRVFLNGRLTPSSN